MKQSELINHLITTCQNLNTRAEEIQNLDLKQLTKRKSDNSWNVLECYEHLNRYLEIYNQFFKTALNVAPSLEKDQLVKSGYFGKKFIQSMEADKVVKNKMKTFKSKNPINQDLETTVINSFIKNNLITIKHLDVAKSKNIHSVKTKLTIPLMKIKLVDSFQFIIAHNKRHMIQIESILDELNS